MEGQFHVDRRSTVTTQESFEDHPAVDSNRAHSPFQFVVDIEQLLGADSEPDPLFFVESWTLGVDAAVESFRRRRLGQADRKSDANTSHRLNNLQALAFVQERELNAEFLSSAQAAAISDREVASRPPRSPEWSAEWEQDLAAQECGTHASECENSEEIVRPMTLCRAREILGVTATSTRRQIKAAYRQMVSSWHPDRLECRTEEVRQFATAKMVAINAAYRLLRSAPLQK